MNDTASQQDIPLPEHSKDIQVGKELLKATAPFAQEFIATSWREVSLTFALLLSTLTAAGLVSWWPLRAALSVMGALLIVRTFITYHDYMHGALLRQSRLARWMFDIYAAFGLVPSRSWKKSHNYHHGHIGQISPVSVGAFPLITRRMWQQA
jgi:omega-6 fatty acid desaturase (delta-12 desaturase)